MNARSAQFLAAALAFLLIVLTGALIFVLLNRPGQTPRPSGSGAVAVGSPSPLGTVSPAPSLGASPTLVPTSTPTTSLAPTPTPEITPVPPVTAPPTETPAPTETPPPTPTLPPTPSPSPTPEIIPTSPQREVRVSGMGLDNRSDPAGVERNVLFKVDGPSVIRANLTSTARVRICLWRGSQVQDRQCITIKNGTLEQGVLDAGTTSWTLTLIGVPPPENPAAPTVDLSLDFNAISPAVTVENLRFQGDSVEHYNGITANVDVLNAGDLVIDGAFDIGEQHSYHVVIEQLGAGGGVVKDEPGGPANAFEETQSVLAATSYRVTVSSPVIVAEPSPVFVKVRITWP